MANGKAGRPTKGGRSVFIRADEATYQRMQRAIEKLGQLGPGTVTQTSFILFCVRRYLDEIEKNLP